MRERGWIKFDFKVHYDVHDGHYFTDNEERVFSVCTLCEPRRWRSTGKLIWNETVVCRAPSLVRREVKVCSRCSINHDLRLCLKHNSRYAVQHFAFRFADVFVRIFCSAFPMWHNVSCNQYNHRHNFFTPSCLPPVAAAWNDLFLRPSSSMRFGTVQPGARGIRAQRSSMRSRTHRLWRLRCSRISIFPSGRRGAAHSCRCVGIILKIKGGTLLRRKLIVI